MKRALTRLVLASLLWSAAAAAQPDNAHDPVPASVRPAMDRAVRWLLNAQGRDGSWGDNPGSPGDIGNTCIAVMALLSTGDTIKRGPHARPIRRGVDWLLLEVGRTGRNPDYGDRFTLMQSKLGQNVELYLATLLFGHVIALDLDPREHERVQYLLRQMAARISASQQQNGAFEQSYEPMLTTISAWLALRQAHFAGVSIKGASVDKVVDYLKRECFDQGSGIFREQKWGNQMRFVTQAGGLRVLYGMGQGQSPEAQRATEVLLRMKFDQDVGGRAGGEEFLGAVFATHALHIEGGPSYRAWYPRICAMLVACQNQDGSWFGHHCITGRVFCTSCSIITFATPRKFLLMSER